MEKNSKHSNKSKLQISNSNLGRIPWNKDLKGIKTNNKGGTSWNKDIPCNDNTKEKISNKLKLNYENGYINVGYKRLHYRGYQPDNDEIINDVNNLLENNINGLYKENNKTILQII